MKKVFYFIVLFLFISCSSEKTSETGDHRLPDTDNSTISSSTAVPLSAKAEAYSLEIAPVNVTRNSRIYAVTRGFSISDAQIEWLVNGYPSQGTLQGQFSTSGTKKNDKVQAKAIVQGKEILSNIIEIKNSPPEISGVRILPEVFKAGDKLYIEASGSDIDEDEVTILYEWTKNGVPSGNSREIAGPLKRGDQIDVKITPYDGEDYGRSIILHREILNVPPVIIESQKYDFDGNTYTHQVKATDPDGDELTYTLKEGPPGMTIDPKKGLIRWQVPPDFTGTSTHTVSVTDGHGGETTGTFTLDITSRQDRAKHGL